MMNRNGSRAGSKSSSPEPHALDPKFKAQLAGFGVDPLPMTPADFGKFIAADAEKRAKVVKFAGIKPE